MKAFKEHTPTGRHRSAANEPRMQRLPLTHLTDARDLKIPNDMRVGARVFRAGSPVSDVLAAATAAYNSHPVTPPSDEPREVNQDRKAFLHRITRILHQHSGIPSRSNTAVKELLDAFMVRSVADVYPADYSRFEKRLAELLS